jgi:hypothetical protein
MGRPGLSFGKFLKEKHGSMKECLEDLKDGRLYGPHPLSHTFAKTKNRVDLYILHIVKQLAGAQLLDRFIEIVQ